MFAIVYRLSSPNFTYFGSTTQSMEKRYNSHIHDAIYHKRLTSHKLFEDGDVEITILAKGEFKDKKCLKDIERYYIENNTCINKNIPNRDSKEYEKYRNSTEKRKEYRKKYFSQKVTCEYCGKNLVKSSIYNHQNKYCYTVNQ